MIAVTGATGQLGQHVIETLLKVHPASQTVAIVRDPAKAAAYAARGVVVRKGDYENPASLDSALSGVSKLLLISSSEVGKRAVQHQNVIDAAKKAGVGLIVYTSLLHADSSPLSLADEHRATEESLKASGVPYTILRNGWYTENYLASLQQALSNGAFIGSVGNGKIASAPRQDYAEAAVVALTKDLGTNKTFELAGDEAYTLSDLAAEVSRQTGKPITYTDMPESDYAAVLVKAGLPEWLAAAIASWDTGAAKGALYDDSHELSRLIARPTTSLQPAVKAALKQVG